MVSLKDRGKYQGFISAACSLGTAVGPFVGGGLASAGQWRWLFWSVYVFLTLSLSHWGADGTTRLVLPLCILIVILTHYTLPLKPVTGSAK